MQYHISICGASGTGKSSIIEGLKLLHHNNPKVVFVDRKSSRSILAEWNVTLEDVNSNHALTCKFQEEMIKRKFNDDFIDVAEHENCVIITERCFVDLFVYCIAVLSSQNKYNAWINNYFESCAEYNSNYDEIFYLPSNKFSITHDGVRPTNIHFNNMIDATMKVYMPLMQTKCLHIIEETELFDRIHTVNKSVMNALENIRKSS